MKASLLNIDCSVLEGGGQIIRNALALSGITGRPVRLNAIRHNRPVPGLSKQHLEVARLLCEVASATIQGAELRSCTLDFYPGEANSVLRLDRNIGSAGAISLVIQSVLPYIVAKNSIFDTIRHTSGKHCSTEIELIGGTNVPFSPPMDHLQVVMMPVLASMNVFASATITKRGFYPAGGGKVIVTATPSMLTPLKLISSCDVTGATGTMFGTGTYCTAELQRRLAKAVQSALTQFCTSRRWGSAVEFLSTNKVLHVGQDTENKVKSSPRGGERAPKQRNQHSTLGAQVCLLRSDGVPISANVLFEGKNADFIDVDTAAHQLISQLAWVVDSGACVDEHTADQLIIFMALCAVQNPGEAGRSQILVAPKIEGDLLHTVATGMVATGTEGHWGAHWSPASTDPTKTPALFQSSLHLESAVHIAQLFLDCTIEIEEIGPRKCRLVTCVKN
jgi:RNA 3'-phosphate cyclase